MARSVPENEHSAGGCAWGRGGARDTHQVTATMVKELSDETGEVTVARQNATGDGAAGATQVYNETESGINITLEWDGGGLVVSWQGAQTEKGVERIEIPFSERFRSQAAGD